MQARARAVTSRPTRARPRPARRARRSPRSLTFYFYRAFVPGPAPPPRHGQRHGATEGGREAGRDGGVTPPASRNGDAAAGMRAGLRCLKGAARGGPARGAALTDGRSCGAGGSAGRPRRAPHAPHRPGSPAPRKGTLGPCPASLGQRVPDPALPGGPGGCSRCGSLHHRSRLCRCASPGALRARGEGTPGPAPGRQQRTDSLWPPPWGKPQRRIANKAMLVYRERTPWCISYTFPRETRENQILHVKAFW